MVLPNSILIFSVILLVIANIIKQRYLRFLTISLAIIALMPYLISAWFYFNPPTLSYKIYLKNTFKENNEYIYDMETSIRCEKGRVILLEDGISFAERMTGGIGLHPIHDGTLDILGFKEGLGLVAGTRHGAAEMYSGASISTRYRITTKEKQEQIPINCVVDLVIDNKKLGIFSIFRPYHEYRYIAKVDVDFKNLDKQKGYFKKAY